MSKVTPLPLAVTGLQDYRVALTQEALAKRDTLLEAASLTGVPATIEDSRLSAELASKLKGWAKEVESSRVQWKAPILDAGRILDRTAAEATARVLNEIARLEKGVTRFHQLQEEERCRILEEQEKARIEHEVRIAAEQKAELDRIAEIRRQEEAAARLALEARTKKERLEASKKALELEAQRQEAEFAREIAEPELAPEFKPPAEIEKSKGVSIRKKVLFEVLDIHTFYAAYPDYVELKPKAAKINALINLPDVDPRMIPGLRTWEETISITRAS